MPVVSQSIIRPMVPVGASTLAWELRTPYSSPSSTASSQALAAALSSSSGTSAGVDLGDFGAVHAQDIEHAVAVLVEAGKRADTVGDLGAGSVGLTGQ